jgi:hypothetical protein
MSGSAQDHLAIAQQHVIEAEEHVARQRELLTELERDSHAKAAKLARAVLETLEKSLELAREHLEREQDEAG